MRYTKKLVAAFVLSVAIHIALGFYLDHTPWSPGGREGLSLPERLMQVQLVPESTADADEMEIGGDPETREAALRKTLEGEAERAPKLPDIPQQEWFSPESIAIPAPEEDLVAHADSDLSNLPGDPQTDSIQSELIKVPEPRVEAPEPDSRVWSPKVEESPPPSVDLDAPPLPPPMTSEGDLPVVPDQEIVLPPPVEDVDGAISPPLAPVELPKEILAAVQPVGEPEVPDFPEDRADFKPWDELLDVQLSTFRPEKSAGYFRVVVSPNEEAGKLRAMSKDVLFAIDASGSMGGEVFESIQKGLADSLSSLKSADRFNVLTFRADVVALNPGLWPATEKNIAAAKEFILGQEAGGKTDIYRSLSAVVRSLPAGDRPFQIILCTDGRSTVGLQDSREIINALSVDNHLRAAIHVFGAGEATDEHLLGLLAYRNKGIARFAENPADIPRQIAAMLKEIADPILVGIQVDLSGMTEEESYPLVLPDLYRGGKVEFFGRFDREKEIALRLTGNVRGNLKEFVYRGDLPKPETRNGSITREWASAKAFHLVSQNLELGESEVRTNAIQDLVKTYDLDIPSK